MNSSGRADVAVSIERHAGTAVVSIAGELDLHGVVTVEAALEPLLSGEIQQVIFDLAGLRFIDSSGMAILLRTARATNVSVENPSKNVRRVLEATGLIEVLQVKP